MKLFNRSSYNGLFSVVIIGPNTCLFVLFPDFESPFLPFLTAQSFELYFLSGAENIAVLLCLLFEIDCNNNSIEIHFLTKSLFSSSKTYFVEVENPFVDHETEENNGYFF